MCIVLFEMISRDAQCQEEKDKLLCSTNALLCKQNFERNYREQNFEVGTLLPSFLELLTPHPRPHFLLPLLAVHASSLLCLTPKFS